MESSTAAAMLSTGGSVNFAPRLLVMNDVTQNETRSGRSDLTISIRCSSLQEFSHSPTQFDEHDVTYNTIMYRAKECFLALMRCTIDTSHEDIDQRNWLLP